MGQVILCVIVSLVLAFLSGVLFTIIDSSHDDNVFGFFTATLFLVVSIFLSICASYEFVENKEYSSTKYNLKKKVITTEENNAVKLDTIYTFTRKEKE